MATATGLEIYFYWTNSFVFEKQISFHTLECVCLCVAGCCRLSMVWLARRFASAGNSTSVVFGKFIIINTFTSMPWLKSVIFYIFTRPRSRKTKQKSNGEKERKMENPFAPPHNECFMPHAYQCGIFVFGFHLISVFNFIHRLRLCQSRWLCSIQPSSDPMCTFARFENH